MNWQALGLRKERERKRKKEAQPTLCEENFLGAQKRAGPGHLGIPRNLVFSGNAEMDQLRLGQFKGACS